jgi:hypothetical protein
VVFDVHVLVPDIDEAASVLIERGWIDAGPPTNIYHFLTGPFPQRRLKPPAPETTQEPDTDQPNNYTPKLTTTVLLPASNWNVPIDNLRPRSPDEFVPPLPILLDAMIDSLLDSPDDCALRSHLVVLVGYLYTYCKTLKTQDFAKNLRLDHRQYHYDVLSKPGRGTIPFLREQRQIRAEIREGKRRPQRNSWYLPPSRP